MKRSGIILIVAIILVSASAAAAGKPARGCGASFTLVTRRALLGELREDFPEASEEELRAFLDSIDKNGDDRFCDKTTPSGFGGTVVDNTSSSKNE